MSKFGENFDKWRQEKGEEPLDPETIQALNKAMDNVYAHKDEIVQSTTRLMTALLQQDYRKIHGRWYLCNQGKRVRRLTVAEVQEEELERPA